MSIKYLLNAVLTAVCLSVPVFASLQSVSSETAYNVSEKEVTTETTTETVKSGIYVFDMDAEESTTYYANEDALLSAYGFEGEEPFFQYFDEADRIYMEFYWDEQRDVGCGLRYLYYEEPDKTEIYGFGFSGHTESTWDRDMYATVSVYGDTGESSVENYTEYCEYTPDGRIDYYVSKGEIEFSKDMPEEIKVLEIDYVYRDDSTLERRDYNHYSRIFGTTYSSVDSYFDEKERLIYEYAYITYGCLEYFYIYTDETAKPAYCLRLDTVGWGGLEEFTIYK